MSLRAGDVYLDANLGAALRVWCDARSDAKGRKAVVVVVVVVAIPAVTIAARTPQRASGVSLPGLFRECSSSQ